MPLGALRESPHALLQNFSLCRFNIEKGIRTNSFFRYFAIHAKVEFVSCEKYYLVGLLFLKTVVTIVSTFQANVMLEYDLEEGDELLRKKKTKAEQNLKQTNFLIDNIRENVTTIEVNMARVYNWDVRRRQAEKEKLGIAAQ